jgi:hypothetical protein
MECSADLTLYKGAGGDPTMVHDWNTTTGGRRARERLTPSNFQHSGVQGACAVRSRSATSLQWRA